MSEGKDNEASIYPLHAQNFITQTNTRIEIEANTENQQAIQPEVSLVSISRYLAAQNSLQFTAFKQPRAQNEFDRLQLTIDHESGELKAFKKFLQNQDYYAEKSIYESIISDFVQFKEQLSQLSILPCEFSQDQKIIYFVPGVCSLQQLLDEPNFSFTADQAAQIFTTLLEFMLLMKQRGYCHSDIKPENSQLVKSEQNQDQYILKIIHFATVTKDQLEYNRCTPAYFNSPLRDYDENGFVQFNCLRDRFNNEFYSILRILQQILLGKENYHFFQLNEIKSQQEKLEKLKKIQQLINEKQKDTYQDSKIHKILDFISMQGLEEKYSFEELEGLLAHLKASASQSQIFFCDSQKIIPLIAKNKQTKIKQLEGPLAFFVKLNKSVIQMGSFDQLHTDPFNLLGYMKGKILKLDDSSENIVLFTHKSIQEQSEILQNLQKYLNAQSVDYEIVLINIEETFTAHFNKKQASQKLCALINDKMPNENLPQPKNLLILLSGYHEIITKNLKINDLLKKKFKNFETIKIVMTSCYDNVTQHQIHNALGKNIQIHHCPFDQIQRDEFIKNFLLEYATEKDYFHDYKILESFEDYQETIKNVQCLNEFCNKPFKLFVVMLILPELKKLLLKQSDTVTNYQILELFVNNYTLNRIKNSSKNQTDDNLLTKSYEQNEFINKAFAECKIFNQLCSWNMLKLQKLELNYADIQNIITENKNLTSLTLNDIVHFTSKVSPILDIYCFIDKSFKEFYIAQSIIEETLNAKLQAVDENRTMLSIAYLRSDLDILTLVAEQVMVIPLNKQYLLYFETWYKSIILTRKIKKEQIQVSDTIKQLQIIGSNCLNLLAGPLTCDLTYRDFSDCSIPNAYFCRRDLSGCNFSGANMENSVIINTLLNKSYYIGTNLKNIQCYKYKEFISKNNQVYCIAVSSDGKYLASGNRSNTVKLWNVKSQNDVTTLKGHRKQVYSVAFSPDGKYLASGSQDKTVKLWSIQKQKIIATLKGSAQTITSVAFSPDGKYLASGCKDKMIKLWSVESQKEVATLIGHSKSVSQVAFSPDGKYLASGSYDKTVKLWSIESQKEVANLEGHNDSVRSVAFSPDGKYLASGGQHYTVKLWRVQSQKEVSTLQRLRGLKVLDELLSDSVSPVSFSPDGKYLAYCSHDETVKLWSFESQKEVTMLKEHSYSVNSIVFSPDGKYLASSSDQSSIKLWNVEPQKEITALQENSNSFFSVAFSPDGKYLASGDQDMTVKLWSIESQKEVIKLQGHTDQVLSVAFSPDGKYLASGSEDTTVKLWSIESQKELATLQKHKGKIYSVAFSPDGKYLASGSGITIKLWSFESQEEVTTLKEHNCGVNSVTFSPDARYLAYISQSKRIKLWNLESQKEVTTLKGHRSRILSVAFSPDAKYLASGSQDQTIKLWSFESQKEVATLQEHNDQVLTVAFSPDGKYLASGSSDNMVKLWSVQSQKEIATLKEHSDEVLSVAFSPDGKHLASGSKDKTVKLWSIQSHMEANKVAYNLNDRKISSFAFSPDNKCLASACYDKTVQLWSGESYNKQINTLQGHKKQISCVTFSPDGNYLASGSQDKTIKLWSTESYEEISTLQGHSRQIKAIQFSSNGKYLASGSHDKTIKLWSLETKKEIKTLQGHLNCVNTISFSPDGKYLVSGSSDKTVKIWFLEQQEEVITLKGHMLKVNSVAFSPQSNYFVSASSDRTIKLWNIQSQKEVSTLIGHSSSVNSVMFQPNGKYIVSVSNDGTFKLWSIQSQNELTTSTKLEHQVTLAAFSPNGKYLAQIYGKNFMIWDLDSFHEIKVLQDQQSKSTDSTNLSPQILFPNKTEITFGRTDVYFKTLHTIISDCLFLNDDEKLQTMNLFKMHGGLITQNNEDEDNNFDFDNLGYYDISDFDSNNVDSIDVDSSDYQQSDNEGNDDQQSNNEGIFNEQSDNEGSFDEQSDNEGNEDEQSDNEGNEDEQSDNEGNEDELSDDEGGIDNDYF